MRSFDFDPIGSKTFSFNEYLKHIETFLSRGIDYLVDFGSTGDSIKGSFGVGGTVEAICTALTLFPDSVEFSNSNSKRHLILLPTSLGTDHLPLFRTCPDDIYASAPLPALLAQIRSRQIFLSLVAPGLSDSTVVDQFIVFKCNEKIGGNLGLNETLGPDWVVRLSSSLIGDEPPVIEVTKTSPTAIDDNEFLNQTFVKLAAMPPEERVVAIKTLLDPATSTFSNQFRQKFAAAVKSRLDSPRSTPSTINSGNSTTINTNSLSTPPPPLNSISQRKMTQESNSSFWSGCIRFLEKQQVFLFRVQFIAVDSQSPLPRASLENWPQELNLTGLLDSKKESIQAGLSVGYAFRVNIAGADTEVASYLMSRMCQGPNPSNKTTNTGNTPLNSGLGNSSHLACFRISQDVLIMLRALSLEDLQFVGYLIDRRFPKNNLTPAAQAASNAINSLTAIKVPLSTTLSTGIEGISLQGQGVNISGRRPSFDVKMSTSFSTKPPVSRLNQQQINSAKHQGPMSFSVSASGPVPGPMTTNYLSYPQFIQQQSPVKIAAISAPPSASSSNQHQLLTDPQAILQKIHSSTNMNRGIEKVPIHLPTAQPNDKNSMDDQQLDQSFVDAWLN